MTIISGSIDNELAQANLPDKRLTKRLCSMFEKMSQFPNESLPTAFGSHADMKGAYRFFANPHVSAEAILEPHYQRTLERVRCNEVVLLVNDTTDLSLKHMECVEDLGVLNNSKQPGCNLHALVAFTTNRLCLGIVSAIFLKRDPDELGKKIPHKYRSIENKESYRWIMGYRKACEVAQKTNSHIIYVADQESEMYELFAEYELCGKTADFLIRSKGQRLVSVENGSKVLLKSAMELAQTIGRIEFTLQSSRGRKNREGRRKREDEIDHRDERKVVQQVKILEFSCRLAKKGPKTFVRLRAVYLEELNPPLGEKPVNWLLLTSLTVNSLDDAKNVVSYYLARWGIETFFHVLKTGCQVEKLQFENGKRFIKCVSLYLVVAWRVLYVMMLGRNNPEIPCDVIFEVDEWESAYAIVNKKRPPEKAFNLGIMMGLVARLGGHLGRANDAKAGPRTIWKGLQRVYANAEGWKACKESMSRKSCG